MRRLCYLVSVLLLSTAALAQSDEIVPNENLVAEGIPKIPAALAQSVGRYSEFRSAFFATWHPTRREMLIETRFGDTNQVHQLKFPGGARTQLTFFPDRIAGAAYQPVDGNSFLFVKDVGGGEFFQLYRYDIASGDITLLTDGKSRNTDPRWSYQGDRVAYASTQRTGNDLDIWVVSVSDPASAHMVAQMEGGGWGVADWSPDGKQLLLLNEISAAETYVWLLDIASGKKELLTPKTGSETVASGNARFAKNGKGVYMTSDADSEFQRLVYLDLGTHKTTVLTPNLQVGCRRSRPFPRRTLDCLRSQRRRRERAARSRYHDGKRNSCSQVARRCDRRHPVARSQPRVGPDFEHSKPAWRRVFG